ncbi:MAG: hypothetical protein Q8S92_22965 [Hydrogenophaga sp.]|uniref:hypothetical protein n=1 Tax=Hydrogenophaga sp. TaxID=1904254 RepID=UPI002734F5EC|nr:hypothetical protein [Hydrogenophaga sp.]MDP3351857.1 hypothetical protein [Hydrogenophaga sp.]
MVERQIPFKGAMVRALLAGTKTQTRRVVKPEPVRMADGLPYGNGPAWAHAEPGSVLMRCPYGQRGDRLWVREAWRVSSRWDALPPRDLFPGTMTVAYDAGGHAANYENGWEIRSEDEPMTGWRGKLRPGMFMPRWASRITLEVTGVRVERLQDISKADAIAEGIEADVQPGDPAPLWRNYRTGNTTICPIHSYETLWESINGLGSWDANPWVWVVEFKRVQP